MTVSARTHLGLKGKGQVAQRRQQVAERQVGLPPQAADGAHVRQEPVDELEGPRDCHEHHQRVLLGRLRVEAPDDVDVQRVRYEASGGVGWRGAATAAVGAAVGLVIFLSWVDAVLANRAKSQHRHTVSRVCRD